MNKHDFLNLIGSHSPVDRQLLGELNELISIFPYFHTAHLLLLKGLRENSDIRFENQLRTSAIHVADREVLSNLLKVSQIPELQEEVNPLGDHLTEEKQITEVTGKEIEPDEPEKGKIPSDEIMKDEAHDILPVQEVVMQGETAEIKPEDGGFGDIVAETLQTGEVPAEEPVIAEVHVDSYDVVDIEQTVIESARNSEELINEIEKNEQWEEFSEENAERDLGFDRPVLVSVEAEPEEPERSIILLDEQSGDTEQKIFFMDPGFAVPGNEEEDEIVTIPSAPESVTDLAVAQEERADQPEQQETEVPEQSDKVLTRQTQADLIDKFIMASPRIEPVRDKATAPAEDLSKPFTEERGSFVTETLARIYINQGYYSKAIEIYEKLCLKFPEKSGYFAAQIEGIKAIIK